MASIGSLVAELSANTASFQKDMGKAAAILNSHAAGMNRTVAGIQKTIGNMGSTLGAALSAGSIIAFGKSVVDMGDQFAKMSTRTGVSVEKLSEFSYGAKLANVSTEEMANGLKKLAVNMADAAANGGGQMAETFRALGISVTDSNGKLRDTASVFDELGKKFADAEDGPNKVAIAVKLMGKSGENLIPLLNDLSKTSAEARKLGLVMSTEAAKNAEAFNDQITKLWTQLQYQALPALTSITKAVRAIFGSEDVDILMGQRAKAAQEYSQLIGAGMSKNSARIILLLNQIDALDAKIIESNKNLIGSGGNKQKTLLPTIDDTGQIASFKRLMDELEKATAEANAAMTLDDEQRSNERLAIAAKEFENKAELAHLSVSRRMEFEEKFLAYQKTAAERAAFDLRSPLQKLSEKWEYTTKQMKNATVSWANHAAESLTDLVMTGKASFGDFANAIIRDLVRIGIQRQLAGLFGLFGASSTNTAGERLGNAIGAAAGFADGGNPPVGKPYWVGENGPELRIDRTPSTIIPGNMLGGKGGNVYNIDARGADRTGLDRLEQLIRQLDGSIEHRAVAAAANNRARGGVLAL